MKSILSIFLIFHLFLLSLGAVESFYLMPRDGSKAVKALANDLRHAKKSIKIAIYSFTHRELANAIKAAAKRGVAVTVIFDKASNTSKSYTRLGDLAKLKHIKTYTLSGLPNKKRGYMGKMHMKLAVIDGTTVYFGSANWSYSAFSRNYELLYSTDSPDIARDSTRYFNEMLNASTPYD